MTSHELASKDYSVRRGELSAYGRALNSSRHLTRLVCVIGLLVMILVVVILLRIPVASVVELRLSLAAIVLLILVGLAAVWWYTTRHFIEPDLAFRKWLQEVCDGGLDARIDLPTHHRHYKELDFHTRNLASALAQLSADMESLVESQTAQLENRRRVLEMMLRLTEEVSGESGEVEVLKTVAQHLAVWFGNATVLGYLVDGDELQQIVCAESGTSVNSDEVNSRAAPPRKPTISTQSSIASSRAIEFVTEITWDTTARAGVSKSVKVPFFKSANIAGMLLIELSDPTDYDQRESERVLLAVSDQLTLFLNKQTALEQMQQSRLLDERTRLAADIHDSLAQTLLAARYKATLLQEVLDDAGSSQWADEVRKIEGAISEANREVRELIREYRSPLTHHRSAESIQHSIERFRESSDLQVFFQSDNPHLRFTPREESVVQRIISEALNNAKKYANANTIRVFLQYLPNGIRTVLIEDDGQGFCLAQMKDLTQEPNVDSSEHIGLSIMQERALNIGAIFDIDSEPGEGTRVSLRLPPLVENES